MDSTLLILASSSTNTSIGFIGSVIIGALAGWAAGKLITGSGFGVLMNVVIGIVGGLIGGWIMNLLGFSSDGRWVPTFIVSLIGALVLLWIVRALFNRE